MRLSGLAGRGLSRRTALLASAVALACVPARGQIVATKTADNTIDTAAWVAVNGATYGRAMNGNSFQTSTITTFNGYQYAPYWKNTGGSGFVAVARRPIGGTWSTLTVPDMVPGGGNDNQFRNGANDAHNVISLGIDQTDGTLHLAYDMHGHPLRYRVSAQGVATNPSSFSWASASTVFPTAERSNLNGPVINGVTYPVFVRTPANDLQLAFRIGSSGQGSWWMYDYSGTTHAWSDGHQIDDGLVDTYSGTSTGSSSTRNNYPNNFNYGTDGKLHSTFTWRKSATGAANHDILYVYSEDGGDTWRNNAGAVVGDKSLGTKFHLTSPGLIARPLAESQTLMNQNGQAVDHGNRPHAIVWHRDRAKDPSLNNPWEPQESSYFQYWRDNVGNWHQNKLNGNVGQRPKIFFDANDNAIAIYQVLAGGGPLSGGTGGNLYITNGDLVIAAATKASNWTDWKIIKTETGNFVSEAQADAELFALNGTLSVVMQNSPTLTTNAGTALRSLDYSINFTAPGVATFSAASGDWNQGGNWNPNAVPGTSKIVHINNDRSATVSTAVPALDNMLIVGSDGSAGSLNVGIGATLNLLGVGPFSTIFGGSIIVGRDGGAVGKYTQSGGEVNAWRFAVGDYFSETSGGGVSSATVSGGVLTTYELDVAFSANASSSGSTFNITGGAVNVNGDAIIGEFGNTGSINLSGGQLTVLGDLREGFNKVNTSNFRMDGGTLDMTNGYLSLDNFIYNGGTIQNVNAITSQLLSGMTIEKLLVGRDQNASFISPANGRVSASQRIEVWQGASLGLGLNSAISIGTTPSFTAGQINVTAGGVLAGEGFVAAAVNNAGGTVSPGHSIGLLNLTSSYTQGAAAVTEIELAESGADRLAVAGLATLAGTLRVTTIAGETPLPGQTYDVITFGSRSGEIALDNQTGFAGLLLSVTYSGNAVQLTTAAKYMGDANLDGFVSTADFTTLSAHFNESGANWLDGDFNGDGLVNALDFNAIASNFGAGGTPPGPGALVPEPWSGLLALPTLLLRRRFRG